MHVQCPHCHNPVEIVFPDDDPLAQIACPSCGSSFHLISGQSTETHHGAAGRTIGHFRLIEQLGQGHIGSVWKSHDEKLDRTVAVKIPRREHLDPQGMEQFLREARASAQLKHPNIVPVHEVGVEGETIYIVSDYIQGLATLPLARRCTSADIDRQERKGEKPSDHAPVVATFQL